ncbi:alpha/beta hydrolase family protein [Brachymonas denitrificans]|uniref:alpha/beta hydrolase family protein n=1 Tax=Brachymonas denitrificans TaxID=28220 RepID=UPI002AFDCA3A|nr:alpha/beta fold hydrolase [Brachymonas denitrificans]
MLRKLFLLATLAAVAASAQARLQEERLDVPVTVQDRAGQSETRLVRTSLFRDDASKGEAPVAIILHGRPADSAAKADMGRARFSAAVDFFVKRGYVVAVPTRIGYGVTGGRDVEASGNCERREFGPGFQAAADQALAVLEVVRKRPGVAHDRTVLVGHSYGGIVALAAAARKPAGLQCGGQCVWRSRRRSQATSWQQPCSTFPLAQQLRSFGTAVRVPTLWLYATNDRYFGATVPKQWFDAYSRIGGAGEFVDVGRVGADGHALFTHFPGIWQPRVASFLDRHGLRAARTGRGSKS